MHQTIVAIFINYRPSLPPRPHCPLMFAIIHVIFSYRGVNELWQNVEQKPRIKQQISDSERLTSFSLWETTLFCQSSRGTIASIDTECLRCPVASDFNQRVT